MVKISYFLKHVLGQFKADKINIINNKNNANEYLNIYTIYFHFLFVGGGAPNIYYIKLWCRAAPWLPLTFPAKDPGINRVK